eukprot:symbB.v1.2.004973.t1/scaffold288.1/size478366/3
MALKIPRKDGPCASQNAHVLAEEYRRASGLCHPNLVAALCQLGPFTVWNLVVGVAKQLTSVVTYCTAMRHILWDVHGTDAVISLQPDLRLVLLDVFMTPDPNSGAVFSLPPELRRGGSGRMKILEDLGTAAAVRINHFAAAIFLAHSLWPSVGLEDVERSTWLQSKPKLLELMYPLAGCCPNSLAAACAEVLAELEAMASPPAMPPPPPLPPCAPPPPPCRPQW